MSEEDNMYIIEEVGLLAIPQNRTRGKEMVPTDLFGMKSVVPRSERKMLGATGSEEKGKVDAEGRRVWNSSEEEEGPRVGLSRFFIERGKGGGARGRDGTMGGEFPGKQGCKRVPISSLTLCMRGEGVNPNRVAADRKRKRVGQDPCSITTGRWTLSERVAGGYLKEAKKS